MFWWLIVCLDGIIRETTQRTIGSVECISRLQLKRIKNSRCLTYMFLHLYEFVIVTCALATFLHSFFFLSFVRTTLLLFSLAIFDVVLCGPKCRRKYDVLTNFCFGSSSCFRFHMDETTKTLSVQHNKQYYYRWNGSSSYIQDTSYKVHAYLYICYQHRVIFKRPHWIWKTFSLSDSLAFRIRKYELS